MAEMTELKRALPDPAKVPDMTQADSKPDAAGRKRRSNRRTRTATDGAGTVRYFLGKPSKGNDPLELGEEVETEARALLNGYKQDEHIFEIREYEVAEKVAGGRVGLAKQPVSAGPRVSNVNRG